MFTDFASVEAMVREAVQEFGRIDYCANMSGIICYKYSLLFNLDGWQKH